MIRRRDENGNWSKWENGGWNQVQKPDRGDSVRDGMLNESARQREQQPGNRPSQRDTPRGERTGQTNGARQLGLFHVSQPWGAIDLRVWKELSAHAILEHIAEVEVTRGAFVPAGFPEEGVASGEAVVDADGRSGVPDAKACARGHGPQTWAESPPTSAARTSIMRNLDKKNHIEFDFPYGREGGTLSIGVAEAFNQVERNRRSQKNYG